MRLKVYRIVSGVLEENGYVIYHEKGGECFIIDPGGHVPEFIGFIRANALEPKGVLLTHNHSDHTARADIVAAELGIPVYMHPLDAKKYRGRVDCMFTDGDKLFVDHEEICVLHTPGHTCGSVCLMARESRMCFTGDTIFDTDLGRTDLSGGSEAEMERTIRNIVSKWDGDIEIYPGHDSGCTMKAVHMYNSEYLALTCKAGAK